MTRESGSDGGEIQIVTTETGPDEFEIVATATIESRAADVWTLLQDWERFLAVGLPGLATDFEWLSGGPGRVPSTFQFAIEDTLIREEIYESSADEEEGKYSLRYRVLEPVLGILEYDAVFELQRISGARTRFHAVRDVRFESGEGPDGLTSMIEAETRAVREHFA